MRREFDEELRRGTSRETEVLKGVLRWVYSTPQSWNKTRLFDLRRIRNFKLEENQFFPMGDNSAASADARSWTRHYVSRELLIGKALVLLWPHPWNRPVPLLPNVRRMGLIR
jgi:signal peptidase I